MAYLRYAIYGRSLLPFILRLLYLYKRSLLRALEHTWWSLLLLY
jgi:hypothetical protein